VSAEDRDWRARGTCNSVSPDVMFPEPQDKPAIIQARAVCAGCPVGLMCLGYALTTKQEHGVWAGLTPDELRRAAAAARRRLQRHRKARREAAASQVAA